MGAGLRSEYTSLMRAHFLSAALALLPTVCGPSDDGPPSCTDCNAPQVCATLCFDAGPGVIATGCVTPMDGGYFARDGGPFVECSGY